MVPLLCWQVFQLWTTVKTEIKKQIETSPSKMLTLCVQVLETLKQRVETSQRVRFPASPAHQDVSPLLPSPPKPPFPIPSRLTPRRCVVQLKEWQFMVGIAADSTLVLYVCITIPSRPWWRAEKWYKASPRTGWIKPLSPHRARYSTGIEK